MISVSEADRLLEECALSLPQVSVPLVRACGRVLRQDLRADRDFPPFHRVTMDGIAFDAAGLLPGTSTTEVRLLVGGVQSAGEPAMHLSAPQSCIEIMTGAVLPKGEIVTIVPVEDVQFENDPTSELRYAVLKKLPEKPQQWVHAQGVDRKKGDLLIPGFRILSPAEIAIAATIGMTDILVTENPRITLVATGNEVVSVDAVPLPHQIRMSNGYMMQAALQAMGIEASLVHLSDDKKQIVQTLGALLEVNDAIILSGGVSMGKFDFIPAALQELSVQKIFHRVQQKPGKPFWFGKKSNCAVFGLPGNPVSTTLCLYRYVLPWLSRSMGLPSTQKMKVRIAQNTPALKELCHFIPARLRQDSEARLVALPLQGNGSGDFANLIEADGFIEIPEGSNTFSLENLYAFHSIRGTLAQGIS